MGFEIERKFLVPGKFPAGGVKNVIRQGYLTNERLSLHYGILYIYNPDDILLYSLDVQSDALGIKRDMKIDSFGFLQLDREHVARVRTVDSKAYLTLKGASVDLVTPEYEYEVPAYLFETLSSGYIRKVRYTIPFEKKFWEVDRFISPVDFVLAEVELSSADEIISIPDWVGEEVTGNPKYFNSTIFSMCQL